MAKLISNFAGQWWKKLKRVLKWDFFCCYPIASLKREEYRRMRIVPAHVTKHSFSCLPRIMWPTLRMCLRKVSTAWGKNGNDINRWLFQKVQILAWKLKARTWHINQPFFFLKSIIAVFLQSTQQYQSLKLLESKSSFFDSTIPHKKKKLSVDSTALRRKGRIVFHLFWRETFRVIMQKQSKCKYCVRLLCEI